jgi:hypothetical protein
MRDGDEGRGCAAAHCLLGTQCCRQRVAGPPERDRECLWGHGYLAAAVAPAQRAQSRRALLPFCLRSALVRPLFSLGGRHPLDQKKCHGASQRIVRRSRKRRQGDRTNRPDLHSCALVSDYSGEGLGFRSRLGSQFLGQEPLEFLVLVQRRVGQTGGGQQPDQPMVRLLAQRISADRAPSILQCAREVTGLLHIRDQLVECLEVRFGQVLPLRQDPVLKVAGKQLTVVEFDGFGKPLGSLDTTPRPRGCLECGLELRHIGPDSGGVQLDCAAVGEDHSARGGTGRLELVAQRGEREAEFVASGTRFALGPKPLDQHLTPMGEPTVVSQIGEQSSSLVGLKTSDRPVIPGRSQLAQQLDLPHCVHFASC